MLAPIPFDGTNGAAAVKQEQIPREAHLRPRVGERVQVGGIERVWRAVQLEDYMIDFNRLLGEETELDLRQPSNLGRADPTLRTAAGPRERSHRSCDVGVATPSELGGEFTRQHDTC